MFECDRLRGTVNLRLFQVKLTLKWVNSYSHGKKTREKIVKWQSSFGGSGGPLYCVIRTKRRRDGKRKRSSSLKFLAWKFVCQIDEKQESFDRNLSRKREKNPPTSILPRFDSDTFFLFLFDFYLLELIFHSRFGRRESEKDNSMRASWRHHVKKSIRVVVLHFHF